MTAAHTYGAAGTYTVTLTVSDAVNATNGVMSVTFDVAASNVAPVAGFTTNLVDYGSPSFKTSHTWMVALHDTSTDEAPASLSIAVNWGDGSIEPVRTGAGADISHVYQNAGSYTISYRVTDSGGMTASLSQPIKLVKYQVGGKVTRANGTTAISGVKMDLRQGAVLVKTAYTDGSGNYVLTNLKPGTYTIVPAKTGFTFGVVPDVTVGPDATSTISSTTP
jgi:PKD repeat protein